MTFFHGADRPAEEDDKKKAGAAKKGDGMHHHEIDEDEGGGYHSKHTHPDGREEHEDHSTYEEARDHQDRMFGHDEPDGDEGEGEEMSAPPMESGDASDLAGSYGRRGRG